MKTVRQIVKSTLFYCVLVAVLLRLAVYIVAWYDPKLMMGAGYMSNAAAILDKSTSIYISASDPVFKHPIGFGMILAFFQLLTGSANAAAEIVRVLAILLDSSVCLLIYVFCKNWLYNPRAGKTGAWIYAVLYPIIVNTVSLHPDSLAPFCVASILAMGSREMKGWKYALPLAGVLAGLFYYLRSEMLLLGLTFAVAMLFQPGLKKRIRRIGIMLLCNAALIAPWLIFTQAQVGAPVLNCTNAWGSAYEALGQYKDNPWGIVLNDAVLTDGAKSKGFISPWSIKANDYYKNEFINAVKLHPDYYTTLVGRRLEQAILMDRNLFYSQTVGGYTMTRAEFNRVQAEYKEAAKKGGQAGIDYLLREPKALLVTNPSRRSYYGSVTFLLVTAALGLLAGLKKWRGLVPIILFYGYYVFSISIVKQIEPKNMYALFALLAILSGIAVEWAYRFLRKILDRRKKAAARGPQ